MYWYCKETLYKNLRAKIKLLGIWDPRYPHFTARDIMSCPSIRNHLLIQTFPPNDNEVGRDFAERDWNRVSSPHEDHIRHFPDRKCARRRRWPGISHLDNSSFSVQWLRFHPVRSRKCPRNFHLAILHDFSLESRHTVLLERLRDRYFMCRFIYIDDAVEKMLNCLMVNLLNQCREQRNRASYSRV